MEILTLTITLSGLILTTLCSAVPPAMLPACTPSNNGLTVCGSSPSSRNDIFKCNNLAWDLLDSCTAPNAVCENGACTLPSVSCEEGETKCSSTSTTTTPAAIPMLQPGTQQVLDSSSSSGSSDMTPHRISPRDFSTSASDSDTLTTEGCREGQLKCMAADAHGRNGAVYKCNSIGLWKMIQDCSQYERCVRRPWAHCTWMGAYGGRGR